MDDSVCIITPPEKVITAIEIDLTSGEHESPSQATGPVKSALRANSSSVDTRLRVHRRLCNCDGEIPPIIAEEWHGTASAESSHVEDKTDPEIEQPTSASCEGRITRPLSALMEKYDRIAAAEVRRACFRRDNFLPDVSFTSVDSSDVDTDTSLEKTREVHIAEIPDCRPSETQDLEKCNSDLENDNKALRLTIADQEKTIADQEKTIASLEDQLMRTRDLEVQLEIVEEENSYLKKQLELEIKTKDQYKRYVDYIKNDFEVHPELYRKEQ